MLILSPQMQVVALLSVARKRVWMLSFLNVALWCDVGESIARMFTSLICFWTIVGKP